MPYQETKEEKEALAQLRKLEREWQRELDQYDKDVLARHRQVDQPKKRSKA